ncbi:MAG TPA: energy transducer TonB [Asticcacaulis sp.]|nr:energy transducer TonB [Asticcacaulis sp.]
MDDPVHGRRAAIYATERKRLPPSFYWALAVAVALHAGGAYYLLQSHFDRVVPDLPPVADTPPTVVTMERPDKPKPQPPNVVHVHATPQPPVTATNPIPLVPQPPSTNPIESSGPPALPEMPGAGTTTGPEIGPGPVAPRWTRFPDGNALAEYYPSKAADAEVEGQATVQCVVLDSSGRVSCVVISESPGGYGFGMATVRMVQDKGRVDTSRGDVVKGSILPRQTVVWKLN